MRIKCNSQWRRRRRLCSVCFAVLIGALSAASAACAQDESEARVVRLSFVEGTVGILQPGSSEWAAAAVNTPIEEGYELATQKDSFAEVQFENASTLRLGELSSVHFDRLGISDSGRRATEINFEGGYGTVHVFPDSSGALEVKLDDSTIVPEGECKFRIDLNEQALRVEVWTGTLSFSGPLGVVEVAQNQALTYTPGSGEPYDVASGLTPDDWDQWVVRQDQAETPPQSAVTPANYGGTASGNLYGWSDLGNYGVWTYYPNVGYAWCPSVDYTWAPYSFGRWVWYSGFGYTWVSSEPWGWLPYHYGQWAFLPGAGWAWVPNSFASWSPALVNWYQGPGWIGWTPQFLAAWPSPTVPCPAGAHGCFRALSRTKFQEGIFVTPRSLLRVDPQQGQRVRRPDLPATRLAMLPGTPLAQFPVRFVHPRQQGGETRMVRAGAAKPGPSASGRAPRRWSPRPRFSGGRAPSRSARPMGPQPASPAIGAHAPAVPHSHFLGAGAARPAASKSYPQALRC